MSKKQTLKELREKFEEKTSRLTEELHVKFLQCDDDEELILQTQELLKYFIRLLIMTKVFITTSDNEDKFIKDVSEGMCEIIAHMRKRQKQVYGE